MDGCIEWGGRRTPGGYGKWFSQGREYAAHRLAWIAANGAIPKGMSVLHRCDNPPCVNPEHLFLGTQTDNMRDMAAKGRQRSGNANSYQSNKTHCKNGHEFTAENTRFFGPKKQWRQCKTCARTATREHMQRVRAKQRS